jgi:hypothetical protein
MRRGLESEEAHRTTSMRHQIYGEPCCPDNSAVSGCRRHKRVPIQATPVQQSSFWSRPGIDGPYFSVTQTSPRQVPGFFSCSSG